MIALALGLLAIFLLVTSRHSVSHSSDQRTRREESLQQQVLHQIIKEPPGKWDPEGDQFLGQKDFSGMGGVEIDNGRKTQDLVDEVITRKTPKKGGSKPVDEADHIKGQPEPVKPPKKEGGGSGAVGLDDDDEQLLEYNAAAGIARVVASHCRFEEYSSAVPDSCTVSYETCADCRYSPKHIVLIHETRRGSYWRNIQCIRSFFYF
jgi:hypothetical protein